MDYLVTGAPGWLGTQFVKALAGNNDELVYLKNSLSVKNIRCLVQKNVSLESLNNINGSVSFFEGDIRNIKSIDKFFINSEGSILFHIAGLVHPNRFTRELWNINYIGTKNILQLAIKNKVKRIIVISSNSPVGVNEHNEHLFDENYPYNPYMKYGKSKMVMEQMINSAFINGLIETVILRPCWFYGVGQPLRQSIFFSMVKNGNVPLVGDGENKRSMSYIDNICQGLMKSAITDKAKGETYWIADEKPYSMNKIIDTIENLLESKFKYKVAHKRFKLPNIASKIAYGIDWSLQTIGLYHQKVHVLSEMNKTIACSIKKAKHELGYQPHIDLEEGMKRSIQWALSNNQNL